MISSILVVCFVPGQKGGPGFGKMYNYPSFNAEKDVAANKSFFNAGIVNSLITDNYVINT